MERKSEQVSERFEKVFDDLEVVLGWEIGYDCLHATPVFVRQASELGKLIWNPLCSHNLSGYLVNTLNAAPRQDGRKIGICVKGCDSRSVAALIQEKFITRECLYIVGIPCRGTVDLRRLIQIKPSIKEIKTLAIDGDELVFDTGQAIERCPLKAVVARKCLQCRHPNPVIYDELMGEPVAPWVTGDQAFPFVDKLETYPLGERRAFWEAEFDRCIRCYACRNACPLCICQDGCIAETRAPKWLTQKERGSEKFFYHMIHAFHLAGRCTGCGECERVCPMEIPVALVKEKLNKIVKEMLDYEAGLDLDAKPPLMTFDPGELGV